MQLKSVTGLGGERREGRKGRHEAGVAETLNDFRREGLRGCAEGGGS